ncbi:hypothetical protein [Pseudomonas sp. EA_5y_Pfl2_R50]
MSNTIKLPFVLTLAFLLLGGCMRVPDDLPPLASHVKAVAATQV